jgi:hypothetical protein
VGAVLQVEDKTAAKSRPPGRKRSKWCAEYRPALQVAAPGESAIPPTNRLPRAAMMVRSQSARLSSLRRIGDYQLPSGGGLSGSASPVFADAYLVIAVCFAISAMMVPLMRGVPPK